MAKQIETAYTSIWNRTFTPLTPMDIVVGFTTPQEVAGFARAVRSAYSIVNQVHPDVIFVPERGAGPLAWSIDEISGFDKKGFHFVSLPIGQHTNIQGGKIYGWNKSTKAELIYRAIEQERESGKLITQPLVIDEVQSGSTISTAVRYLYEGLTDIHNCTRLNVIAVIDTFRQGRSKVPNFSKLASNDLREDITTSTINAPLFYVDKQGLLNHILNPDDDMPENATHSVTGEPIKRQNLMMLMHNIPAQEFFRMMIISFAKPELLRQGLDSLQQNGELDYSQVKEKDQEYARRLHNWILEAVTTPNLPPHKGISSQAIIQWLEGYYGIVHKNGTPNPNPQPHLSSQP